MVKNKAAIMVVEDEVIVALELQEKLTLFGYFVPVTVKSGEEAVLAAEQHRPDLILMDIKLKGEMNGTESAASIIKTLQIPVIYLTSYSNKEILLKAKATNPYGYILKPFQDQELFAAIEMALNRFKIERELEESRRYFTTTLDSIGDAVITTDIEGKITLLNPVAEQITGWQRDQAIGRKIEEVFYIVNEKTMEPVASPVAKVIKQGTIIGLANHTLLITRDNRKIPVDDSGAPIIDRNGKLIGVVLVFRDVTEKRKAELALKREAAVSQAIGTLSRELLLPDLTMAGILEKVNSFALNLTGARFLIISFIDPAAGSGIKYMLSRKTDNKLLTIRELTVLKDNETGHIAVWKYAWKKKQSFYINDPARHSFLNKQFKKHVRIENMLSAPAVVKGKTLGHIGLANKKEGFTDTDLDLIRKISDFFAIAIYQKHIEEELSRAGKSGGVNR